MRKSIIFLLIISFCITSCQRNKVIKTHGISYLEKREKLMIVNKTNKNDTVNLLGHPATKGMKDDNVWIYIERTRTRGKLLKFGQNITSKNTKNKANGSFENTDT